MEIRCPHCNKLLAKDAEDTSITLYCNRCGGGYRLTIRGGLVATWQQLRAPSRHFFARTVDTVTR